MSFAGFKLMLENTERIKSTKLHIELVRRNKLLKPTIDSMGSGTSSNSRHVHFHFGWWPPNNARWNSILWTELKPLYFSRLASAKVILEILSFPIHSCHSLRIFTLGLLHIWHFQRLLHQVPAPLTSLLPAVKGLVSPWHPCFRWTTHTWMHEWLLKSLQITQNEQVCHVSQTWVLQPFAAGHLDTLGNGPLESCNNYQQIVQWSSGFARTPRHMTYYPRSSMYGLLPKTSVYKWSNSKTRMEMVVSINHCFSRISPHCQTTQLKSSAFFLHILTSGFFRQSSLQAS